MKPRSVKNKASNHLRYEKSIKFYLFSKITDFVLSEGMYRIDEVNEEFWKPKQKKNIKTIKNKKITK